MAAWDEDTSDVYPISPAEIKKLADDIANEKAMAEAERKRALQAIYDQMMHDAETRLTGVCSFRLGDLLDCYSESYKVEEEFAKQMVTRSKAKLLQERLANIEIDNIRSQRRFWKWQDEYPKLKRRADRFRTKHWKDIVVLRDQID
jgi:hypothetical protein